MVRIGGVEEDGPTASVGEGRASWEALPLRSAAPADPADQRLAIVSDLAIQAQGASSS